MTHLHPCIAPDPLLAQIYASLLELMDAHGGAGESERRQHKLRCSTLTILQASMHPCSYDYMYCLLQALVSPPGSSGANATQGSLARQDSTTMQGFHCCCRLW